VADGHKFSAVRRLSRRLLDRWKKKLSYHRGPARHAMLVNSCYVSRRMGDRKVPNSTGDLQRHSRALAMVPFHDFLLDFHCNHVLHRFRDIITYFPKLKEDT